MRKFSIISLLVFMAVFALITVSYSKSWAHIDAYDDGIGEWVSFINWYPLKIKDSVHDTSTKYTDFTWFIDNDSDSDPIKLNKFIPLVNASLAFAILAWVGSLVMIILSVADIMEIKLPPIGKFFGWAVFLFSLLSFLIYLGTPAAKQKDCQARFSNCEINLYYQNKFFGKFTNSFGSEFKYGPSAGWNCIVIACAVSLVGSIFNILFFNHQTV
ncbi:hypothetical protein ACTA71_012107 [Dictyostelium dimigraforme]